MLAQHNLKFYHATVPRCARWLVHLGRDTVYCCGFSYFFCWLLKVLLAVHSFGQLKSVLWLVGIEVRVALF